MTPSELQAVIREAVDSALELSQSDVRATLSGCLSDLFPGEYCYVCDVFGDDSSGDVVYSCGSDMASLCGVRRKLCSRRSRHPNYPPNCPPTSVLLVLKIKFFTKYSLCTHGDSEGRKLRDQEVGGSNPLAPTKSLNQLRRLSYGKTDWGYLHKYFM
jgi:hypothetical protein